MQETYRLITETLWLLEAYEDPDFDPHMLSRRRTTLIEQLEVHATAMEADSLWSSQHDSAFTVDQTLPIGWTAKVQEPSREYRFTARGPDVNGHRVLVTAKDPDTLEKKVRIYDAVITRLRQSRD